MKRILIVEDEPAVNKLLGEQLKKAGYEICVATNGKKGLDEARNHEHDLILLDLKMPVMDGVTMLELLRKEPGNGKTKVVILSNLEPDDTLKNKVEKNHPLFFWVKSNTAVKDLMEKIEKIFESAEKDLPQVTEYS